MQYGAVGSVGGLGAKVGPLLTYRVGTWGLAKTHLQHVLTAVAINMVRIAS